ncbi:RIP metalloprotease RseP [Patescibacteria group bacterium]
MLTVIVFILVLGLLVFVHELGHFVVAIRNGIKADEFGFGFPPRLVGLWKNDETGKYEVVWGNKEIESKNTIYSINLIPLGGFVRIKGENGEDVKSEDSFSSKPAWARVKVLGAGVTMNFVLGWILLSIVFLAGTPEAISDDEVVSNSMIQVSGIIEEAPAQEMGLMVGDELVAGCNIESKDCEMFLSVVNVQDFIGRNEGKEIVLRIKRGGDVEKVSGVPRVDYPDNQGSLGISMVRTSVKSYVWYEAVWRGFTAVLSMMVMIVVALFTFLKNIIFGSGVAMEVSGPVGIAIMTKQVVNLGIVHLLQFTAVLSVNLGIINILPIPALDGGRILFILIEKIKGSPISEKFEHTSHAVGFFLLIGLMVVVTFRDFIKFDIVGKIFGIF